MRTYSEASGQEPFNWYKALADAIEQKIDHELDHLSERSGQWTTCACGNLCDALPRHQETGRPLDPKLGRLGMQFHDYVQSHMWNSALETLEEIEARSVELLAALNG